MSILDSSIGGPPTALEHTDPRISDAPEYSPEAAAGETSLSSSPTIRNESVVLRTFFARHDDITLTFVRQPGDIPTPRYGRAGCVSGQVRLASTFGVTSVSLHLEGKIGIDLEERLPTFTYRFLEIPLTLWEKGATDEKAPPFAMQFKIDLPETFTDGEGKEHPLPPSYELDSNSLDDFHVQCSYTVSVRMARSRFLPSKLMVQKLKYDPRTVPPSHTLAYPFPYLSLTDESLPHGWRRYDEVVIARPQSGFRDVHCQLYTPALHVYSMKSGPIPYFLRVHGHRDSIAGLLCDAASIPSQGSPSRSRWSEPDASCRTSHAIEVHVKRQVSLATGDMSTSRSYAIGKGTLRDVPPVYQPYQDESTVDYEGEIQIEPTVVVGGFDVGKLSIADFFILSIKAVNSRTSAFEELAHSHPIRMVTGL